MMRRPLHGFVRKGLTGDCPKFCVNGQMAGNCRPFRKIALNWRYAAQDYRAWKLPSHWARHYEQHAFVWAAGDGLPQLIAL